MEDNFDANNRMSSQTNQLVAQVMHGIQSNHNKILCPKDIPCQLILVIHVIFINSIII